MDVTNPEWVEDCKRWRGKVLTGEHSHWCPDWDLLPIDETTPEWPCVCCKDNACQTDGQSTSKATDTA